MKNRASVVDKPPCPAYRCRPLGAPRSLGVPGRAFLPILRKGLAGCSCLIFIQCVYPQCVFFMLLELTQVDAIAAKPTVIPKLFRSPSFDPVSIILSFRSLQSFFGPRQRSFCSF